MKKLLLFGGTSEEHSLLKVLAAYPIAVTLCVASEYGKMLLPETGEKLKILAGRLDKKQMLELMCEQAFLCVVDATHPYAVEVSDNIKAVATAAKLPYLRLLRQKSQTGDSIIVPSVQDAAEVLEKSCGNVLITTGSKELSAFTKIKDFKERLYVRVLPTAESVQSCLGLGFSYGHIIAMQGPFSKELNMALLKQFNIKTMVTKDGGKCGGFPDKLEAAKELDVDVIVVGRPQEEGFSEAQISQEILRLLEAKR
jgi:precorrin-6x reductase